MALARRFMASMAVLALAVSPAVARQNVPTAGRSIATVAQVPLKSRDGTRILLGSRVAPGIPTLIAFWASWCGPCYGEAPYLDRLRKQLGGRYNFLYINRRDGDPDLNQPPASVARFLAYGGMTDIDYLIADISAFRHILGADSGAVPEGKVGIPRVYLFDRNGRQIYASYGFDDTAGAELERRVTQAVAER